MFPGYLFAHIAPETDDLVRIRSAPGVAYVLPRAGAPVLLPDRFIESVRSHEGALEAKLRGRKFQHGDRIVVVSGPFKWAEGLFDRRLNAAGRVRILLNLVHRSMAVQTGAAEIEHAKPAARAF
jgi:transcriptional antiterminator RfaH